MAEGLVANFLTTFMGLQEMERQRRKDKDLAAQQAVENELRRMEIGNRREAQDARNAYYDETLRLRQDNLDRQSAADTARKALGEENAALRRENADLAVGREERLAKEGRQRMVGAGLARGETQKQARMSAGMTDEEIDADLQRIVGARMPAAQQAQGQAAGQNMQNVVAPVVAQAIAGMMGAAPTGLNAGAPTAMPGLPTVESVGREQSQAFLDAEKVKEAQIKATLARADYTAARATQFIELGELQKQLEQAKLAKEQSQNLVNSARYKEILASIARDNAKWNFDQIIRQGNLDLGWANHTLNKLRLDFEANRDYRASVTEAKQFEQIMRQYKSDKQDQFEKTRDEIYKVYGFRQKAKSVVSQLKAAQAAGEVLSQADATAYLQAQATLAQYSDKYYAKLNENLRTVEADRNDADRRLKAAQNLYSKPMTQKGTMVKQPGAIMPTDPSLKSPVTLKGQTREWMVKTASPVVRVRTPAEASKLKAGTRYVTPDGREFIR